MSELGAAGALAVAPAMRKRIVEIWDTVVSLHLVGEDAACARAEHAIIDWLHEVDETFSTFDPESAISRWHRGLVDDSALPSVLIDALQLARQAERETEGAFRYAWAGRPDPMGLLKGFAGERAVAIAAEHGVTDLQINAGGDVRVVGSPDPAAGKPWRLGVTNPFDVTELVDVVAGHDLALATSGSEHRGNHIVGDGARAVTSASVLGPEGARADAYATALVATADLPGLMATLDARGWSSLVVTNGGGVRTSARWPGEVQGPGVVIP